MLFRGGWRPSSHTIFRSCPSIREGINLTIRWIALASHNIDFMSIKNSSHTKADVLSDQQHLRNFALSHRIPTVASEGKSLSKLGQLHTLFFSRSLALRCFFSFASSRLPPHIQRVVSKIIQRTTGKLHQRSNSSIVVFPITTAKLSQPPLSQYKKKESSLQSGRTAEKNANSHFSTLFHCFPGFAYAHICIPSL